MSKNDMEFERAFGNFLESRVYDKAENSLFEVARAAFLAGWKAAGGEEIKPEEILTLLPEKK